LDLGGNGIADIDVGAPLTDSAGIDAGRVYAFSGQSGAQLFARSGDGAYGRFGGSVAIVPALDGSGSGTLLVGATEQGSFLGASTGAGYVRLFSAWSGSYPTLGTLAGNAVGDRFGCCVAPADDVNQDGFPDFVVGAYQAGTSSGGQGLALLINGGTAQAGNTHSFLFSSGHLSGTGPILGLGLDAISNYTSITSLPPWTGTLDQNGAARIDVPPGTLPSGVDLDTIFFTLSPQGQLIASTGSLEFDTRARARSELSRGAQRSMVRAGRTPTAEAV
jgi:hypothetical protein